MDISVRNQLSVDAQALVAALKHFKGRGALASRVPGLLRKLSPTTRTFFEPAALQVAGQGRGTIDGLASLFDDQLLDDVLAECAAKASSTYALKSRGAVFTPSWLAQRVTSNAHKWWSKIHGSLNPDAVGDVSCGTGAFLSAASAIFPDSRVFGLDIDHRSLAYAELLAAVRGMEWHLECEDTLKCYASQGNLFGTNQRHTPRSFDVLLGNPPYVRSANLEPAYAEFVKANYKAFAVGNSDLSVAFLEHAIDHLNDGGVFSYVVSSKFSQSNYGAQICRRLSSDVRVLELEHFADHQLFRGYTTYVMALTVAKLPPAKRFTLTTFAGGLAKGADPGPGKSVTVASAQLASVPWEFASGAKIDIQAAFQKPEHPLITDVFGGIFQGVRTGANDVFVLDLSASEGVERSILLPYVTGRQIERFHVDDSALRLIYPYAQDGFGNTDLLNATTLRTRYPLTWKHLSKFKGALQERSTDHSSGKWFGYSRSQNLGGHRVRKLLVKEMMARAEFAADFEGALSFGSGYALDASKLADNDLRLWTAVLNTPTMEFVLRSAGTQLHSGWFRLLKHHLKRVRLPRLKGKALTRARSLAQALHEKSPKVSGEKQLAELDRLVASAFGLSDAQQATIAAELSEAHKRSLGAKRQSEKHASVDSAELVQIGVAEHDDQYEPVKLSEYNALHRDRADLHHFVTAKHNKALPRHKWYSYTQGYSAGLVDALLDDLAPTAQGRVLDPFCGGGTTNLACAQAGQPSIGFDVSPLMCWVARTKLHNYTAAELRDAIAAIDYESAVRKSDRTDGPPSDLFREYFAGAYTPQILAQLRSTFSYLRSIEGLSNRVRDFLQLGAVSLLEEVSQIRKHGSHYRFLNKAESVGVRKLNIPTVSDDLNFAQLLRQRHLSMLDDVKLGPKIKRVSTEIAVGDARQLELADGVVECVITSPPYLNRNNYIAQQKAELAMMGLVSDYPQYRDLVRSTFRSHVESHLDKNAETEFEEVARILRAIKLEPGNNAKIPHMIAGYFADLAQTLRELFRVCGPRARVAFVVGNTRWGGVVIPIDHLLMKFAERAGFSGERILVTRLKGNSPQQMRKYGRIPVRESIVIFRKG